MRKFLCRKITAHFKLNLKTDGLICKMIFKFGEHVERLHSVSKQGGRIYNVCTCKQCVAYTNTICVAKRLLESTQTLELHRADTG